MSLCKMQFRLVLILEPDSANVWNDVWLVFELPTNVYNSDITVNRDLMYRSSELDFKKQLRNVSIYLPRV